MDEVVIYCEADCVYNNKSGSYSHCCHPGNKNINSDVGNKRFYVDRCDLMERSISRAEVRCGVN